MSSVGSRQSCSATNLPGILLTNTCLSDPSDANVYSTTSGTTILSSLEKGVGAIRTATREPSGDHDTNDGHSISPIIRISVPSAPIENIPA